MNVKRKIIATILAILLLMIQWMPIQYATMPNEAETQQKVEQENSQQEENQQEPEQEIQESEEDKQDQIEEEQKEEQKESQEEGKEEVKEEQQENTEKKEVQKEQKKKEAEQEEIEEEIKTKLSIVKQKSKTQYLENDQGYISNEISKIEEEKGEVSLTLSLNNISSQITSGSEQYKNTEIFIIISENIANDTGALAEYTKYIETLATKVFEKSSNTKIGIVGMQGTISDSTVDENGNMVWGPNDEGDVPGTENNAEIVANLTNNMESIKTDLQTMNAEKKKYKLNLQAAIRLAKKSYSDNTNKILISLYDNVPAIAIGVKSQAESYGGWFSEYQTAEESVIAHTKEKVTKTKSEILSLKENNIDFILLRPDDTSFNQEWYSTKTGEFLLDFDGSPYVQELYGTLENPTYGKMYSLSEDSLEAIVTEYIYKDIMESVRTSIKSAIVTAYFPQEILNYFTITVGEKNVSSVDVKNLQKEGYLVWNVGDVPENEVATLEYSLKLKNMKNRELLNKVLSTNGKTELTYVDYLDHTVSATLASSPTIQLTEITNNTQQPNPTLPENSKDDKTVAPGKIAQAGLDNGLVIAIFIVTIVGIIGWIRYRNMKDI